MLTYLNVRNYHWILTGFVIALIGCTQSQALAPSKDVMILTQENFAKTIESNDLVVVDFWAPWCGPCNEMMPTVGKIATAYKGKAIIAKVNVDEEAELATKYKIKVIPCLMFFEKGKPIFWMEGIKTESQIKERLEMYLDGK